MHTGTSAESVDNRTRNRSYEERRVDLSISQLFRSLRIICSHQSKLYRRVSLIRANGTIASYSSTTVPEPVFPYYPLAFKGVTLRLVQGFNLPPAARAAAIADITAWSASGALRHAIAARFALAEIAAAHELLESGRAIGNVVVEIP